MAIIVSICVEEPLVSVDLSLLKSPVLGGTTIGLKKIYIIIYRENLYQYSSQNPFCRKAQTCRGRFVQIVLQGVEWGHNGVFYA